MADHPTDHETLYRGAPTTVFESGCTCGRRFRGATAIDANEKLDRHLAKTHPRRDDGGTDFRTINR